MFVGVCCGNRCADTTFKTICNYNLVSTNIGKKRYLAIKLLGLTLYPVIGAEFVNIQTNVTKVEAQPTVIPFPCRSKLSHWLGSGFNWLQYNRNMQTNPPSSILLVYICTCMFVFLCLLDSTASLSSVFSLNPPWKQALSAPYDLSLPCLGGASWNAVAAVCAVSTGRRVGRHRRGLAGKGRGREE